MLTQLIQKRAAAFDAFKVLADKEVLTADEQTDYDTKMRAVNHPVRPVVAAQIGFVLSSMNAASAAHLPSPISTDLWRSYASPSPSAA